MGRYKIGQTVWVKKFKKFATIICECKEPSNFWSVALRQEHDSKTVIMRVNVKDLLPYKKHCWNCDCPEVNSDVHETCGTCKWVICPNCKACKIGGCQDDGLLIYSKPGIIRIEEVIEIDDDWEEILFDEECLTD
ncbi:hypothetical protein M4D57_24360 [Brevibacillus borstelensis]|uniref:hypothetical protein n=1 Tax=Brevibacillus borstelensis TaxID=45462 RepID=UPI00046A099B|nr:hypothetical protein [Brevibacillus borstelensis]MCC0567238.1 hypothetical protein [Brevibacillus borstelensis]MCM3561672.1 hypothetical protein [Brevibacillus borstelensis]